jgi:hypothetical protein
MAEQEQINYGAIGLNLDSSLSQLKKGQLSYALNAVVDGFDGEKVAYQNEPGNELCCTFPEGYRPCGLKNIPEIGKMVVWLTNPSTGDSEIGVVERCTYTPYLNAKCLNLSLQDPILKAVVKITNCSVEVYWRDRNGRRYLDLTNPPYRTLQDGCARETLPEIDCNKLLVQPHFQIPSLQITDVLSDGDLVAGTYQFGVQYCNVQGEAYTSLYSITNPVPIQDPHQVTLDHNYHVGRAIQLQVDHLDQTGFFQYFNLVVIKTINDIATPELVGTYEIRNAHQTLVYSGQSKTNIPLSMGDVLEKFPIYTHADDLTTVQDVLVWKGLTTQERLSYQKIANQITVDWVSYKLPLSEGYASSENAALYRGYMRGEVYALEFCLLLTNGHQTDGFHIPARALLPSDLEIVSGDDVFLDEEGCETSALHGRPRFQVYNTATLTGTLDQYLQTSDPSCYKGPYQHGRLGVYQSTETYPCSEEIWGPLAGQPIRHHRMPDAALCPIHDGDSVLALGLRINAQQIMDLIRNSPDLTEAQKSQIQGFKILRANRANHKSVVAKGLLRNVGHYKRDGIDYLFPNYGFNDLGLDPFLSTSPTGDDSGSNTDKRLDAFGELARSRFTFQSPDTTFFQPSLGNTLRLETAIWGKSRGHFQQVLDHSRYRFASAASFTLALGLAVGVSLIPVEVLVGLGSTGGQVAGPAAGIAAFNLVRDLIQHAIPRRNFAWQYNAVGNYSEQLPIPNTGHKQRRLTIAQYAAPGMISVGDVYPLNNWGRESSVYLCTQGPLPFPHENPGVPLDTSKFSMSEVGCAATEVLERPISAYYASICRNYPDQYGQIYSYETVDTGCQVLFDLNTNLSEPYRDVFGGDTFVNRFAFKSKLPFFLDHRVQVADESDVFYDELGNVAYPTYWFSTDVKTAGASGGGFLSGMKSAMGVQVNNFDCAQSKFFYQAGRMYLFYYGIPQYWCESEVNVDLRGAYNGAEGDFYPHVSSDIPDSWLQERNVSIQRDNTYHYNRTYSKQNKENVFTHLPQNFTSQACTESYPFRAVWSEQQKDLIHYERNSWLVYQPLNKFDFPQNYGRLISIDGLENRATLVRFENKSLLYNTMLRIDTSSPVAAYLGSDQLFRNAPPQDFADSDIGYAGTQHKLLLKTPLGHLSVDARRTQVLLYEGSRVRPLNGDLSAFFSQYLSFSILEQFPDYPIDNHFAGIGLHGAYDQFYNRLLLTKLDYKCLNKDIQYAAGRFTLAGEEVSLSDARYFQNQGFTLSYDLDNGSWIAFHSYLPNFYASDPSGYYSGNFDTGLWVHMQNHANFNHYYGNIHPYVLEYPFAYRYSDEILQSVKDYTKVRQYFDDLTYVEVDDVYFNKAILSNDQQSSGVLELQPKPRGDMAAQLRYPLYKTDSKVILYTKSDSFYNYNTFWSLVKQKSQRLFVRNPALPLSFDKEPNQGNLDYSKRSFKKEPLRAKDLRIRHILDNQSQYKFLSEFVVAPTKPSLK